MKHLSRTFAVLGFIFQYGIPLALLSSVVALTHEGKKAGLTIAGIITACVFVLILLGKLKNRILLMKNQIVKQSLLSISPFVVWGMIYYALNFLAEYNGNLSAYWLKIAPFILLGRMLYIVSGIFANEAVTKEKEAEEAAIIEKVKEQING